MVNSEGRIVRDTIFCNIFEWLVLIKIDFDWVCCYISINPLSRVRDLHDDCFVNTLRGKCCEYYRITPCINLTSLIE